MFGKRKSKTKPEAAVGVSIKRNSYSEFVNIPRIILPEPETEPRPVLSKEPIKVVPFNLVSQKTEPRKSEPTKPEISKVEHSKEEPPKVEPPVIEPNKVEPTKEIVSSITYPPPPPPPLPSQVQSSSVPSSPSLDKIKNSRFRVQSASFKSENKVEVNKNESPNKDEDGPVSNPDSDNRNGQSITTTNGSGENHDSKSSENEPPLNRIMRRKSVFAEAYNPEEEEDESERIIHAKSDEQRIRLGENVKNIFLFRSLDHDQIGEVLDAMFERRVKENEYVIKQGDDGDNFYVIESGIYNIFVETDLAAPPKLVGKYENSGSFGELALMYNLPRAATIQAVSTGSLWAMDRQTFRRIVLKAAYKKRKMYESLLEKVPMLKALQNYERMNLADALVPRIKLAGELIIKQGDAAEGMYFVEEGSVRVVMVNSDNQEKEISRVNVGGYFGELALVTKKPRAASIFAVDKVRLAFLDVEAFERLLGPCMDIMKRNIEDYENELLRIFGSQANISDIR